MCFSPLPTAPKFELPHQRSGPFQQRSLCTGCIRVPQFPQSSLSMLPCPSSYPEKLVTVRFCGISPRQRTSLPHLIGTAKIVATPSRRFCSPTGVPHPAQHLSRAALSTSPTHAQLRVRELFETWRP